MLRLYIHPKDKANFNLKFSFRDDAIIRIQFWYIINQNIYIKYQIITFFFPSLLYFEQQQTMDKRKAGFVSVGDLEGCIHYKVVKFEKIKFLVIALKDSIEIYAWAPKPYHKFMSFKVRLK